MVDQQHIPVITIDGPSGTGKGTLCYRLAHALGWHVLDSGAIYRVLAFAAMRAGIMWDDTDALVALAHTLPLRFAAQDAHDVAVYLNDEDIRASIRTEACGQQASRIAADPAVRLALLERQRAFAQSPGLVTDGRDMGTVVFPDAWLKIYLDASAEARAQRRYLQLKKKGEHVSLAHVIEELSQRDARDMMRAHAPLVADFSAMQIDTTDLSQDQVFTMIMQLVRDRGR